LIATREALKVLAEALLLAVAYTAQNLPLHIVKVCGGRRRLSMRGGGNKIAGLIRLKPACFLV